MAVAHHSEGRSEYSLEGCQSPLLVVRQARRRYRMRRRPLSEHFDGDWEEVAEKSPEYQRLLARLVELSALFQNTLSPSQKKRWLKLEDALFAHAFFLHVQCFKAGYRLARVARRKHRPDAPTQQAAAELLSALAKLLDRLDE
jgi:hypothetical protein